MKNWILLTSYLFIIILHCITANSGLNHAESLIGSGKYSQALKILDELLLNDPNDPDVVLAKGICLANIGRLPQAASQFEKAAILKPSFESFFNAGMAYQEVGNTKKAMINLQQCIHLNTKFRECYIKLASAYRNIDDYERTQELLHSAIKLDPKNPDAYGYLAETYNNLKQFTLAIKFYNLAISMSPKDFKLWTNLGDAYSNQKKTEEAFNAFKQAKALFSDQEKLSAQSHRGRSPPPPSPQDRFSALLGLYFAARDLARWEDLEELSQEILSSAAKYDQFVSSNRRLKYSSEDPSLPLPIPRGKELGISTFPLSFSIPLPRPEQSVADTRSFSPNPLSPYRTLFLDLPPLLATRIALDWSSALTLSALSALPPATVTPQMKSTSILDSSSSLFSSPPLPPLRISYISRRFHNYPGTQLLLRLPSSHNHSRVSLCLFPSGPNDDHNDSDFRSTLLSFSPSSPSSSPCSDDLSSLSALEGARRVLERGVDVIFDYDGLHDFNNLKLLSLLQHAPLISSSRTGPPPIALTWLGFAGTTGQGLRALHYRVKQHLLSLPTPSKSSFDLSRLTLPQIHSLLNTPSPSTLSTQSPSPSPPSPSPSLVSLVSAIQFLVADSVLLPPDLTTARLFTEHLVLLPDSYQPQDPLRGWDAMGYRSDPTPSLSLSPSPSPSSQSPSSDSHHASPTRVFQIKFLSEMKKNAFSKRLAATTSSITSLSVSPRENLRRKFLILIQNDLLTHTSTNVSDSLSISRHSSADWRGRDDSVWLAAFTRTGKIDPSSVSLWASLLLARPHSLLVLLSEKEPVKEMFRAQFSFLGVHPSRLLFLPRLSPLLYRLLLSACDLFLDTSPYGSHTVAADALAQSLPVATLTAPPSPSFSSSSPLGSLSSPFASRVGRSLNAAIGSGKQQSNRDHAVEGEGEGEGQGGLDLLLNLDSVKEYMDQIPRLLPPTPPPLPLSSSSLFPLSEEIDREHHYLVDWDWEELTLLSSSFPLSPGSSYFQTHQTLEKDFSQWRSNLSSPDQTHTSTTPLNPSETTFLPPSPLSSLSSLISSSLGQCLFSPSSFASHMERAAAALLEIRGIRYREREMKEDESGNQIEDHNTVCLSCHMHIFFQKKLKSCL